MRSLQGNASQQWPVRPKPPLKPQTLQIRQFCNASCCHAFSVHTAQTIPLHHKRSNYPVFPVNKRHPAYYCYRVPMTYQPWSIHLRVLQAPLFATHELLAHLWCSVWYVTYPGWGCCCLRVLRDGSSADTRFSWLLPRVICSPLLQHARRQRRC